MRDMKDYESRYVQEPFEDTMVQIRRRMVLAQCMKYKHSRILEAGCGMRPLFQDFSDFDYMAIVEPCGEFAGHAQSAAGSGKLADKVRVYHDFLENAALNMREEGQQYDLIIVSSLLHEVDDPCALLHAVRMLCSGDTVVHINVPNAASMHRLVALEGGMITDLHEISGQQELMQRRRTYDMEQLSNQVEEAGFLIVDSGFCFIKPFTHAQMQECLDAGIIDGRVLKGLEGLARHFPQAGAEIFVNVRKKGREHG